MEQEIRMLEVCSANALPAMETRHLHGWLLRFANGYTKRANSIYPFSKAHGDLPQAIAGCERIYREWNIRPAYKIVPGLVPESLDRLLEEEGYRQESVTSLQTLSLSAKAYPAEESILLVSELTEERFDLFCEMNGVHGKDRPIFRQMLDQVEGESCYALRTDRTGKLIACGRAVFEAGKIGIFNIVTREAYRSRGYGYSLMNSILQWGQRKGANQAYLQVVKSNKPALGLYEKLGFEESYEYWFRVKG